MVINENIWGRLVDNDLTAIDEIKKQMEQGDGEIDADAFCEVVFDVMKKASGSVVKWEIMEKLILEISPISIEKLSNATDGDGKTLYILAIEGGDTGMVGTLGQCKLNPNVITSDGACALLAALEDAQCDASMFTELLAYEGDPRIVLQTGVTLEDYINEHYPFSEFQDSMRVKLDQLDAGQNTR